MEDSLRDRGAGGRYCSTNYRSAESLGKARLLSGNLVVCEAVSRPVTLCYSCKRPGAALQTRPHERHLRTLVSQSVPWTFLALCCGRPLGT